MSDVLNSISDKYSSIADAIPQKGSNSIEFLIDAPDGGTWKSVLYTLFPGIHLIYFTVNAVTLPYTIENSDYNPLQFNYCVSDRIEFLLDDNTYIYLKENDFSISRQGSKNDSFFPTGHYQGIGLTFDAELLINSNHPLSTLFDLDFSRFEEIYFDKKDTYIAEANEGLKNILDKLWALSENASLFYMRLYVIELLHLLLGKDICPVKTCTFYTGIQVEIAKKAEEILSTNLSRHIPIRLLAEQFSVSETSLKNYFRGVYGQNISTYLRNLRMNTAAKLLTETKIPISEISTQVGYTKQGKFAAVFKEQFGSAPLEYRRKKSLENI